MVRSEDLVVRGRKALMLGKLMRCSIGRSGIGVKVGEGDGITPVGEYAILDWYARRDRLGQLPLARAIGPSRVWSDDPSDPLYNRERPRRVAGYSAEDLYRRDGLYDLFGVMDFNLPRPVPGAGSAIFLHVWRGPNRATEGCIALALPDLLWVNRNWRPWSKVVVLTG